MADEVAKLDQIRFHQTSPGAVYSFASSVAQSISKYGTDKCLSVGSLLNENGDTLPLEEVANFVKGIVPENCFIERCSNGAWEEMEALYGGEQGEGGSSVAGGRVEIKGSNAFVFGKQTEQWYGVDYFVSPVDGKDVQQWESVSDSTALHLPKPNRFIPRSLDLCDDLPEEAKLQRIEKPIDPPKLIVNDPNGESG